MNTLNHQKRNLPIAFMDLLAHSRAGEELVEDVETN